PRPVPLGDFDRVPPLKLLTAVSAPDAPAESGNGFRGLLGLLSRAPASRRSSGNITRKPRLAPNLSDLVQQGHPRWAGNINVFVNAQPVERHRAQGLRIYAGRNNLAMFMVGGLGRPDAYAFKLVGVAPGWNAELYNGTDCKSLVLSPNVSS